MRAGEIDLNSLTFPLTVRPNVRLTDDELLEFSSRNSPWQIERNSEGELIMMTPVTGKGGINEGYVYGEFFKWSEQDGSGIVFSSSAGFNLRNGATLSPDVSWVPLAQWSALTEEQQDSFPPLCPSFIIEVRSKTDPRKTLHNKMRQWIENGAQLAWLVDAIDRQVTIYRPGREPETLQRPEFVTASDPVAGLTLACKRLWPAD